eukprot:1158740-Pelagomonas_calceolata.AAC.4
MEGHERNMLFCGIVVGTGTGVYGRKHFSPICVTFYAHQDGPGSRECAAPLWRNCLKKLRRARWCARDLIPDHSCLRSAVLLHAPLCALGSAGNLQSVTTLNPRASFGETPTSLLVREPLLSAHGLLLAGLVFSFLCLEPLAFAALQAEIDAKKARKYTGQRIVFLVSDNPASQLALQ